jgi:hypothetical protein
MSTVISRLVLVLTYFLFATYAIAEVEVSWGNVPPTGHESMYLKVTARSLPMFVSKTV